MKLTPKQRTGQAKALYEACQTPKPSWDQLGEKTQEAWGKQVDKGLTVKDYLPPTKGKQ